MKDLPMIQLNSITREQWVLKARELQARERQKEIAHSAFYRGGALGGGES